MNLPFHLAMMIPAVLMAAGMGCEIWDVFCKIFGHQKKWQMMVD
jgi:hypothetical protein